MDDRGLILAVKNGDIEAFETLVKKYEAKALNFVFGITKDEPLSEEILQDAFLKIYKNIEEIDTARKFSSYFYTVLKNEAISALRKLKKEVNLTEIEFKLESGEDLVEKLHKKETRDLVAKTLGRLNDNYRRALHFYYFENLSYQEIANKMKVPVNTVRTFLNRGKRELRMNLESGIWNLGEK